VPEHQDVDVGEALRAAALPARGVPRLVHHGEPDPLQLHPRDLRQPFAQRAVVVVAVHADQPARPLLELVEERHVDPVPGVDDDVGGLDVRPQLRRQVARPSRQVGVGDEHHGDRHLCIVAGRYLRPLADNAADQIDD
jgi:hypothetical protein